jgi:hypothetical protein
LEVNRGILCLIPAINAEKLFQTNGLIILSTPRILHLHHK